MNKKSFLIHVPILVRSCTDEDPLPWLHISALTYRFLLWHYAAKLGHGKASSASTVAVKKIITVISDSPWGETCHDVERWCDYHRWLPLDGLQICPTGRRLWYS